MRNKVTFITFVLAMLLTCGAVNAYTIVMRDGRRVEIPNDFAVSTSTLTYQVSPGIQITVQLAAVDIAATERVNKETVGSLLQRASKQAAEPITTKVATARVVTNSVLERFRLAREASEVAYEKRRKELGLPSVEESKQAAMAIGERTQTTLQDIRSRQSEAETYWRNRSSELRAELAAVNQQINLVQARLNELPLNYSFGAFTTVTPFTGVGQFPLGARVPTFGRRNVFVQPSYGPQVGFRSNRLPGHVVAGNFGRRAFARQPFVNGFPFGAAVALPFDAYDSSYERAALSSELDQLLMHRAGLQGRWRVLEDEARTAGAYPGWLR